MDSELFLLNELKKKMDVYKKQLTFKYNRANTPSKKRVLSRELEWFSNIYRQLFGELHTFSWDKDKVIFNNVDKTEFNELSKFIDNINNESDFYFKLSNNVIKSYIDTNYPFYKYNTNPLFDAKLDNDLMIEMLESFLKSYDYQDYLEFEHKLFNLELLEINFESYEIAGAAFNFPSIHKNIISLNALFSKNLFKYETIAHEFGHVVEMQLFQNSNNAALADKALETPFYEVPSSFFEYAFLNYLKDNKVYLNYVNRYFDYYFKALLSRMLQVNIISKFPCLEVDENDLVDISDENITAYTDSILDNLNYYDILEPYEKINIRNPFIYGLGQLFSIYLYDNYKENPNFISEFKKSLTKYPNSNDIESFNNVGITKDKLLISDVLTKTLKKHYSDFK